MYKMLCIMTLLIALAVCPNATGFNVVHNSRGANLELQWNLDSYHIEEENDYSIISFPGGNIQGNIGQPGLPSKQTFVEVPYGVNPTLEINNIEEEIIFVQKPILPQQAPLMDAVGLDKPVEFQIDKDFYARNQFVNSTYAEIASVGVMRGQNLALIRINPLNYNPATGEVRICKSATLSLSWKSSTLSRARKTDNAMKPLLKSMVLNYKESQNATRSNAVNYLIITVPELEANAQDFALWKKQMGYKVAVEIVEVQTEPAAVKSIIASYYPAVQYVLIIADHGQIALPATVTHPYNGQYVPSDLYYACLEGDDYYPDVYMGRVPANNVEEANLLLGKIINYEKNPPEGDWLNRFLLCGEFQFTYQKYIAERLFCETAYTIWNSLKDMFIFPEKTIGVKPAGLGFSEYYFSPRTYRSKILDANGPVVNRRMPDEWAYNLTSDEEAKANTLAFWNDGACIVQHRDHGGETLWGRPSVRVSDLATLNNGDRLPVLFSINCLTGYLDYSSDCFIEAALKNPNGGAVSALAATRISYSWHNDRFCDGIYTCLFGADVFDPMDEDIDLPTEHPFSKELGVILNYGKMYLEKNAPSAKNAKKTDITELTFYLFHCMGDPSMKIWTKQLEKLDVQLSKDSHNLSVVSKNTRSSVANAKVCFYSEDEQIVLTTDENGNCALPELQGTYTLTITGDNLYTYQTVENF